MCNSKNHSPGCTCGFGGDGHRGRRGPSYFSCLIPVQPPRDSFLDRYTEFRTLRRVSACFVNPNATCRRCGASVYYYENQFGSRVYFDELGPPWPKHSCTDLNSFTTSSAPSSWNRAFDIRDRAAIADIAKWQDERGHDFAAEFSKKYHASPWPLATIAIRIKSGKIVFLVLKLLHKGRPRSVYLSCDSLPKCCQAGFLVAVRRQKISFVDIALLTPTQVPVKRFRGAAAFLDAIIESGKR